MPESSYHHEIRFDVPDSKRRGYDAWLQEGVLDWVAHEAVSEFEVYHSEYPEGMAVKFVFSFESARAWTEFTDSDEHETCVARLRTLVDDLEELQWERDGIRLYPADRAGSQRRSDEIETQPEGEMP